MPRKTLLLALLVAAVVPAAAHAQQVSNAYGPLWNRFTLEPYAGRYYDNSVSAGSRFDAHGWMGGLRLGLAATDRFRLVGDVAYSQVDGVARVGTEQDHQLYGAQTWLLTGGAEVDVVPGDTRASLSLQAGSAWRDLRAQRAVGQPTGSVPEIESPAGVIVPGFAVRQGIAPRADLRIGIQDYIFFGADPVSHNWAVTLGLTLR